MAESKGLEELLSPCGSMCLSPEPTVSAEAVDSGSSVSTVTSLPSARVPFALRRARSLHLRPVTGALR